LGDREAEGLDGLEIDDEEGLVELLDREVSGVGVEENALDVLGRESAGCVVALTIVV
jgi:hypothetical protein